MGKSYDELPAPVRRYIDQMRKREEAERLVLQGCIDLATERGITVHDAATILSLELEGPQRARFMTATKRIIEEHLDNVAADARAAALRPKATPTERDVLATAIGDAAKHGGIWDDDGPLTQQRCVALCADMGLAARRQDTDNLDARAKSASEDAALLWGMLDAHVTNQATRDAIGARLKARGIAMLNARRRRRTKP